MLLNGEEEGTDQSPLPLKSLAFQECSRLVLVEVEVTTTWVPLPTVFQLQRLCQLHSVALPLSHGPWLSSHRLLTVFCPRGRSAQGRETKAWAHTFF